MIYYRGYYRPVKNGTRIADPAYAIEKVGSAIENGTRSTRTQSGCARVAEWFNARAC